MFGRRVLSPKELLAAANAEDGSSDKEENSIDAENDNENDDLSSEENLDIRGEDVFMASGKQGYLIRETDTLTDPIVFVALFEMRLLFSAELHFTDETSYPAASVCNGYVDITPDTHVRSKSLSAKKFSFQITSGDVSIIFSATMEVERDAWVEVIGQAISGITHTLTSSALHMPLATANLPGTLSTIKNASRTSLVGSASRGFSAAEEPSLFRGRTTSSSSSSASLSVSPEFPSKSGFLIKKSSSAASRFALGKKAVKKRFFVLEGGVLTYYDDEDVKQEKLKGTFDLRDAIIGSGSVSSSASAFITVQLSASPGGGSSSGGGSATGSSSMSAAGGAAGRLLELEAPSVREAAVWRNLISDTCALLAKFPNVAADGANKTGAAVAAAIAIRRKRRVNIHERLSDEEVRTQRYSGSSSSDATSPPSGRARGFTFSWGSSSSNPSSSPTTSPNPAHKGSASGAISDTKVNLLAGKSSKCLSSASRDKLLSPATIELVTSLLQSHFLLKARPEFDVGPLISNLESRTCVAGEVVFWQGSTGDAFYMVESGTCEVLKDDSRLGLITAGKSFGELALVNNAMRQATIRVVSPTCQLWFIGKNDFRNVVSSYEDNMLAEKIQFLKKVKLFEKLMNSSLEMIADSMVLKSYKPGDKIVKQGEAGDTFYMVLKGRVIVSQTPQVSLGGLFSSGKAGGGGASVELVRLGAGQSFGELALLEDAPRKATVTASGAVQCFTLDRGSFLSLFGSMDEAVKESLGVTMLRKVKILDSLSDKQLLMISRRLVPTTFRGGEVIIKQGDVGDSFYLLAAGEVAVQVNHIQLAVLSAGAFFGEMSLLSNEKRSATVVAIARPQQQCEGEELEAEESARFSSRASRKAKAAEVLNEHLPDISEDADVMCYVLSRADFDELLGPLDDIIQAESKRRADELAAANAAAKSPMMSRLRTLSNSMFGGGGGGVSPGPGGGKGRTSQASNTAPLHVRKSTSAAFATQSDLFDLDNLEKIRRLGSGTFSEVFVVRDSTNNKVYAMKVVHKHNLMLMQQERSVFRERDAALLMADCPLVTALYATLQDEKSLYFIQQYVLGGDLWSLMYEHGGVMGKCALPLTKIDGIQIPAVQFYASIALTFLCYAHQEELVFRDLKPENWVIDVSGYAKVIDFGCAKVLPLNDKTCRTHTLCGCPEYASPEAVLGKGYNRSADLWALGIFIFELAARKTPFVHDNVGVLYQNIVNSEDTLKAAMPSSLDANTKSIILSLLEPSPVRRLGMLRNGMDDVWAHPFFRGTSLEQVTRKGSSAPYIPDVSDVGSGARIGGRTTADLDDIVDCLVVDEFEDDEVLFYRGDFEFGPF